MPYFSRHVHAPANICMSLLPAIYVFNMGLQSVLDNLVKLSSKEGIDRAARDLQLTLVAIYCITFGRLKDDVPMGCRLLLVTEVRSCLYQCMLAWACDINKCRASSML